jgi:hypothetical protein
MRFVSRAERVVASPALEMSDSDCSAAITGRVAGLVWKSLARAVVGFLKDSLPGKFTLAAKE